MGAAAAAAGINKLKATLAEGGTASIIVATGVSQFQVLDLLARSDLPWNKITVFHLDEYVGLPITHGASFRKYLWERFVTKLPLPPAAFHYLDGEGDVEAECDRVSELISSTSIDVAFVGVGENGHLAFNDPPADFETEKPYIVVDLDDACRRQQLGEGWFPDFESVPDRAISMSIRQIMKSASIICTVPDERKAEAIKNATQGPVTPEVPASILQNHSDCQLFLDQAAASLR
ncbi:MAG: glucosamine-6-phosphate deaminase [Opitutae bacterium]|nr:glucosamine-6-phosphate deaminase [Opitutae bacterium]